MKYFLIIFLLLAQNAYSAYSSWAVPTHISTVLHQGIRIEGSFGNPGNCATENLIFVAADHPQYDKIYSMALAAVASNTRLRFEVRDCRVYGWLTTKTINTLNSSHPGEVGFRP